MRKKTLILLGAFLCVVVLGITGVFMLLSLTGQSPRGAQPMEPDELTTHYFSLAAEGKYEELYALLSEQSQSVITAEDFITKYKNIYGGIGAKNISVTIHQVFDYEEDSDDADMGVKRKVVEYSLRMDTVAGEIAYNNQAVFRMGEDKRYRAEWSPEWIFPALTWDGKVRVNTLRAERGDIYDRNGVMLAGQGVASSIGFVPGEMRKQEEAVLPTETPAAPPEDTTSLPPEPAEDTGIPAESTIPPESEAVTVYNEEDIAKVAALLEMTPENVLKKLGASYVKEDTFVLLKTVSKEAYELKEELLTVPGILITDTSVRYYPLAEKASHLVGYIQNINAEELEVLREQDYHMNSILGKAGLEKIYEEQLRAVDGYEVIIVDGEGNLKETLARKDRRDGEDIYLTIDAEIQSQLYDLFAEDKSCSVAMNSKTGEVLALVSTPTYDANDFVLGMSPSKWTALNEDPNLPFWNRFKAALCPGSTMKAITAAIAIDTGAVSPDDDFGHSGLRWRKDESWGGYYITTTMEYEGPANIQNALKFSDNIYFGKAALQIGADRFAQELISIGFEEQIPFEYGLYSSIVSTTETFNSEIQLADSGFGQGEILTNPIHLASVYASFLNDGDILQPNLLMGSTPEVWKENAFSPETARIIRDDLIQVIESGSVTDAKVAGRNLGGKTGTAEIKQSKDDENGTELGWFVEFTADENEERPLLIVSMVEDVKGRGGSHYVSPKVKTLFE